MLSTHRVEVVPVALEPHPNADSLSIVRVWGYTAVVRTVDWEGRETGAYIPPDSIVPATPEFAFLGDSRRIKARRFRGVMSQGLLHPAPAGSAIGDDVADLLGVTHYDPDTATGMTTGGDNEAQPVQTNRYDVDSGYRYAREFVPGEEVIATEKIHGCNSTYLWHDGRLWAKSHSAWKRYDPKSVWWQAAEQNPAIAEWCEAHPDLLLCGEVFGQVQDLKYGTERGRFLFRAFDVQRLDTTFLDYDEAYGMRGNVEWCPLVYRGPFSLEKMREIADGPSLIPGAGHLREGVVIGPVHERITHAGRCKYKFVSPAYLERSK